jgi:hypothetical protein
VQVAVENRSNSNGLDKSTDGSNTIPSLFSRDNANNTNTILYRSKRAVDQAKVEKCKDLERSSISLGGAANIASAVASGTGIFNLFGVSAVASGVAGASYGAKLGVDIASLELGCDDIPFEEIKEILDERFNKVDTALDRNHGAIRENLKAIKDNLEAIRQVDAKSDRNHVAIQDNLKAIHQVDAKADRNLSILGYKSDRNFDAIEKNLEAIHRNYAAIGVVDNKVDRNFRSILSGFKTVQAQFQHTNEKIDQGFKRILDFVKQSKIEAVTSGVIAFIDYFM